MDPTLQTLYTPNPERQDGACLRVSGSENELQAFQEYGLAYCLAESSCVSANIEFRASLPAK